MSSTKVVMQKPDSNQDIVFVQDLIKACIRKWYFFLIAGLIILPSTLFYIYQSSNIYNVGATLLLEGKNNLPGFDASSTQVLKGERIFSLNTKMEDEMSILKSYSLMKKTLKEMDLGIAYFHHKNLKTTELYQYTPFIVEIDSNHNQVPYAEFFVEIISEGSYRLTADEEKLHVHDLNSGDMKYPLEDYTVDTFLKFGEVYEDEHVKFQLNFNPSFQDYNKGSFSFIVFDIDGLAEDHQNNLVVSLKSEKSNILELSMEGEVVPMRVHFIDKLMEVYIKEDLDKQKKSAREYLKQINNRLAEVSDSLRVTQEELKIIRTNTKIVEYSSASSQINQELFSLNRDRTTKLTRERYYRNFIADFEKGDGGTSPDAMGIQDQLLTNYLTTLAELEQQRAEAIINGASETHSKVATIDGKISSIRENILNKAKSTLKGVQYDLRGIEDDLRRQEGRLRLIPGGEQKVTTVQNKINQLLKSQEYWLDKRDEVQVSLASTVESDKVIIDQAKQIGTAPVAPNKIMILLLGVLGSLVLPLGGIVLVEVFNNKITTDDDLESNTPIPILGHIALYEKRENYIMEKDSRSSFAESFRALRIKMLYMTDRGAKQVIGLTSSSSGEGKTFCAINLAAALAHSGKQTLLIDTDLRRPKVSSYFYTTNATGLGNYLVGEAYYMNEVIQSTHIDNLDIITAGNVDMNATDLISNPKLDELILTCREEYDHIVFDTPPIGLVSDYLVLMHLTDYNIYVVRHNTTKPDDLKLINELYESGKIKEIGILINGVKSLADYGYLDKEYGNMIYLKGKKNPLLPASSSRPRKIEMKRLPGSTSSG